MTYEMGHLYHILTFAARPESCGRPYSREHGCLQVPYRDGVSAQAGVSDPQNLPDL
jgi:hypothetical protein